MHYIDVGSGPETIIFSHGLLFSNAMFAKLVEHLKGRYRCIAFDHRGQGDSPVTSDGYDMDTLSEDAINLIEKLDIGPCHFAGLSMGGFVAMRIALRRPDLLKSIILIDTSADPEPEENKAGYRKLNFVARWFGLRPVVKQVMPIVFGKTFMNDPARENERKYWADLICKNNKKGISRAVNGVIDREGVYDTIGEIDRPTLIIVGEEDTATVPAKSERIQNKISGSKLVLVPRAGHSSTIEEPDAVNTALDEFLQSL
jgi:pimeloyl-ACP methyl ester carboxylesterase